MREFQGSLNNRKLQAVLERVKPKRPDPSGRVMVRRSRGGLIVHTVGKASHCSR